MATFVLLKHPVTILVTVSTNPGNLTNELLILNPLIIKRLATLITKNRFESTWVIKTSMVEYMKSLLTKNN